MRFGNNFRRIVSFAVDHRWESLSPALWATVSRVLRARFGYYFSRVSDTEFHYNLQQIQIRPWNLHIELTNICNANCIFCAYSYQSRKKTIMEQVIYEKALGDYCELGGGELRLESCVGDPLVAPDFIERVRQARSHPEITRIITLTNGIDLNRIGFEALRSCGIDEVNISTGPWDADLYGRIYRTGRYHDLRQGVTTLLEQNAKCARPLRIKLLFRSSLSLTKTLNLPDFQHIRNLAKQIEFNTDFDTWLGLIKQTDLLPGMHIRPLARIETEPCYLLYDGPIVFADGGVGLCGCRDFNANSELIIGNIMTSSLLDLWQSEATQRLRRRFWAGDFPEICKQCTTYANLDLYRSKAGSQRAELVGRWFARSTRHSSTITLH